MGEQALDPRAGGGGATRSSGSSSPRNGWSLRLHYGHVDPREAGVGNIVNCGAAMYMAPVGIVNAADPDARVRRGHRPGRRPPVAATAGRRRGCSRRRSPRPCGPGATPDSVVATCLRLAQGRHPGRHRGGLRAAGASATGTGPFERAARGRRARTTRSPDTYRDQGLGARRPCRLHSIEELPLALGFLVIARGDYRDTVLGGGQLRPRRRLDRHAWAGAIAGALGAPAVPAGLARARWRRRAVSDLVAPGAGASPGGPGVHAARRRRAPGPRSAFTALTWDTSAGERA